jgi:hypothetical protein
MVKSLAEKLEKRILDVKHEPGVPTAIIEAAGLPDEPTTVRTAVVGLIKEDSGEVVMPNHPDYGIRSSRILDSLDAAIEKGRASNTKNN